MMPSKPRLYWRDAASGDNARISFPWSVATFVVWRDYDHSHPLTATASLAELDASAGDKYYFDAAGGTMYVKLVVQATRSYAAVIIDPT